MAPSPTTSIIRPRWISNSLRGERNLTPNAPPLRLLTRSGMRRCANVLLRFARKIRSRQRRRRSGVMSERVRFQADANFNALIVKGLPRRQPLIDIQSADAAGLAGMPDPEVLALTAQSGRILVSHDYHTMPTH